MQNVFLHNITQSHSGPSSDIARFVQSIPESFKSDRPIKITGVDNTHSNCECNNGSIVNVIREPVLFTYALDQPAGQKIT